MREGIKDVEVEEEREGIENVGMEEQREGMGVPWGLGTGHRGVVGWYPGGTLP